MAQTDDIETPPAPHPPPRAQSPLRAQPPPRVPRTHTNPTIIQALKSLPLISILKKNKEIEEKNAERATKTLNHAVDKVAFPDPGSDAASLITLDPQDLDRFKVPSYASSLSAYIYESLAKWIADEDIKDRDATKVKRKVADDPKLSAEEARIAKRRCMNGNNMVPWIVGTPWQTKFPQSLFDTEGCVAVPLPFFLNENLQIINVEAATLPTVKTNPNPGETKGISILDVDKLSARFGKELSLTCSQWTEAAGNMYLFQKERDAVDTGDAHSDWYNDHFNFYLSQKSRDRLYDAWKSDELKFRQEHWATYGEFKAYRYEQAFALSERQAEMMAKVRDMLTAPNKPSFGRDNGNFPKSNIKPFSRSRDHPSSSSFPSGSGRSSSSSANCLVCSERGHDARIHGDSSAVVKFKDGTPAWSKYANNTLLSPDNRVLCIPWNIRGDRAHSQCTHRKDERAHQCSFCGSKNHYAFSWNCRQSSSN
jgi:hypothetical protein